MTPPKSPMPRSPMPKSPMICEKYETGCMWHLYGLFNFRQGHSNKKLLSHQRHLKRTDDGNFKTKLDLLNKMDEKSENMGDAMKNKTQTVDSNMTSTRRLKGEELSTELQINKKLATDEVKHMQSDSKLVGPLPKNNGKTSDNRQRSNEIPLHSLKNETKHRNPPSSTSVEKPHSAALPEVLSKEVHRKKRTGCGCKSIDYVKYDQLNENNLPPGQMNAVEAIVSQKFINGVNYQSKQLSDALQILNSNKELFIKLLQDPNSLLVKHIEDLRESQARKHQSKSVCEENISEQRTSKARQSEGPSGIHKLNSCDMYQPQASGDCGFSERIVVLTPTPPRLQNSSDGIDSCSTIQSYYSLRSNGEIERPANFSLSRIKRKLRRAIGLSSKEQDSKTINGTLQISPCQGSEDDSKGKAVEIIRRNSPGSNNAADSGVVSKSSLDIENRVNISKVNECESNIGCEAASTSGCGLQNSNISLVSQPKRKESETFAEAMEHLSELLTNGKRDKNNFERQAQKTLEKVASFPEYDFLPTRSPVRDWENTFVDEPMRFSPYSNYQLVYENKSRLQILKEKKTCYSSPLRQDVEAMPENKKLDQLQVIDIQRNIDTKRLGDNSRLKGCVQIVKNNSTAHRGETNSVEVSSMHPGEPSSLEVLSKPDSTEKTNTAETSDATCQGETDPFEDQPLTSSPDVFSATPIIQRVEGSDNIEDKREQPSPVSVLEHYYFDATSPASTISEPAEEHQSHPLTRSPLYIETSSLSEHHVIWEYVRAVLQASSLNWDELSLMRHSSDQLLDPFLFDAVKLQANQFSHDCMLLFDCINEVLATNKRLKDVDICVPIVYGTVAFYLGRKASESQSHKWTVYVRGATNEDLGVVVKRVIFQLHPSFNNPMRVIDSPPFELTECGWGEFEIAISLFFHNDVCERQLDLYHHLKLYTEDESGPQSTKKPVVVESYNEIVFPDPLEACFARVQNHPAVVVPRLPAGFNLPNPVSIDQKNDKERGDTKDHPLSQWFLNFSEADELLKLAAARQEVQAHIVSVRRKLSMLDGPPQLSKPPSGYEYA